MGLEDELLHNYDNCSNLKFVLSCNASVLRDDAERLHGRLG